MIKFGEWLPDLSDLENPGVIEATNVLPGEDAYLPFPSPTDLTNALDSFCQGFFSTIDDSGAGFNFAGDDAKLYELDGTTWTDVSKIGGYSTAADDSWSFTQFGQYVLASNFTDPIQQYEMGVSSAFGDITASTGTVPNARYIAVVRDDFFMVGNTFDAVDGSQPYRVRWAGIDTFDSWAIDAATQADFQDLDPVNGWITGIAGGTYATIFQERAITIATYIGSPNVFRFDTISRNKGCKISSSIIQLGEEIAFISDDGFYILSGNQLIQIGSDKVDNYFFNDVDATKTERISGTYDPSRKLLFWVYPSVNSPDGFPDKILIYNYSQNAKLRWSIADVRSQRISIFRSEPFNTDSSDFSSILTDDFNFNTDSRAFTGGEEAVIIFDENNTTQSFRSTPLSATITTGEKQLFPGRKTFISKIRPWYTGAGTISMCIGQRDRQEDSVEYTADNTVNSEGDISIRSNSRYHRLRLNASGDFQTLNGAGFTNFVRRGDR